MADRNLAVLVANKTKVSEKVLEDVEMIN